MRLPGRHRELADQARRSTSRRAGGAASTSTSPIAANSPGRVQHQPDLHPQPADSNFQNPVDPGFREPASWSELGDPKDEFRWDFDFGFDECHVRLSGALHRPMLYHGLCEPVHRSTACRRRNVDAFPVEQVPGGHLPRPSDRCGSGQGRERQFAKFYFGVDNVLDTTLGSGPARHRHRAPDARSTLSVDATSTRASAHASKRKQQKDLRGSGRCPGPFF